MVYKLLYQKGSNGPDMTFLLPQTEALGFSSDDLNSTNSLHDAFFDESKQFK